MLIRGGTIVDAESRRADLRIGDGRIVEIGEDLEPAAGEEVLDAGDFLVLPGLIDLHVHLREPGFEWKEDIASGTRAAAAGGVTTVAAMPNTDPVADNPSVIERVLSISAREGLVRVLPIAALTKGQKGEELTEMADLKAAGAVAFSDDGRPVVRAEVMRRALEYARVTGLPVISHAEDPSLSGNGSVHHGYWSGVTGLRGIPSESETTIVSRDILLCGLTGGRLHLAHLSCAGSVRLVEEAKRQGLPVTAEVTPHHLILTDEAIAGYDTATKVNPPLRAETDRRALIEGLKSGTIDIIATDHAPHAREDKEVEYEYAAFGISGIELALPVLYTELVLPGKLSLEDLVRAYARRPAEILGLEGGRIEVGVPADLVILDTFTRRRVTAESLHSKGKNTPFIGRDLIGWPYATIVGGRTVYRDGEFTP